MNRTVYNQTDSNWMLYRIYFFSTAFRCRRKKAHGTNFNALPHLMQAEKSSLFISFSDKKQDTFSTLYYWKIKGVHGKSAHRAADYNTGGSPFKTSALFYDI